MKEITPQELYSLLQNQPPFLLDVREPFEHEAFNIGGELIPLGEVMAHATALPRNRTVVVYCKKGIRSQIAIQRLEEKHGFSNLVNLIGGIERWKRDISVLPPAPGEGKER